MLDLKKIQPNYKLARAVKNESFRSRSIKKANTASDSQAAAFRPIRVTPFCS